MFKVVIPTFKAILENITKPFTEKATSKHVSEAVSSVYFVKCFIVVYEDYTK